MQIAGPRPVRRPWTSVRLPGDLAPLQRAEVGGACILAGLFIGYVVSQPSQLTLALLVVVLCGAGLVWAAWHRPDVALVGLVVGIPFQQLVLARLFDLGVAPSPLAVARFWKEAVLALLILKAAAHAKRISKTDVLAFAFLAVTLTYLVLPVGPNTFYARLIAMREAAGFVIVFLVARHLPLPQSTARRVETAILCVGVTLAALAFWNAFDPASWAQWIESTKLDEYRATLVEEQLLIPSVVWTQLGGHEFVRAGSLLTYLTLPFFLAIPVGIAVARAVTGRASRITYFAALVCAGGILVSLTRSAILVAPIVAGVAFWLGRRKARLALVLVVTAVVLMPIASSLQVNDQIRSVFDARNESRADHIGRMKTSVELITANPLGAGLGTSAGVARRFSVQGGFANESWYLQLGTEMGVLAMLSFFWLLIATMRTLASRARSGSVTALGAVCGLLWIALGGLVLHSLADLSVAWSIWMLVGLAIRPLPGAESAPSPTASDAGIRTSVSDH